MKKENTIIIGIPGENGHKHPKNSIISQLFSNCTDIQDPTAKTKKEISYLDKEKVKEMICKAIDNIPDCAGITDCYTEHSFMSPNAYIKIEVKAKDETDKNIVEFHNHAHDAFGAEMGFIS